MIKDDKYFMELALKLAKKGHGATFPNPMVGAIIVKNNHIIGQGYHKKSGESHAEILAINSAKQSISGSTLYLNLEPHGYSSQTPPCTDAIIKSGINKVVCSSIDPNPSVHGDGLSKLRSAGLEVVLGCLEHKAVLLNEQFYTYHKKKRPFVAIKFATSLDGKLATKTGDAKWITNEQSRAYARRIRGRYQAILVGVNTVIADNPHLGVRENQKPDPVRIILDSKLRIPINSVVLRDKNVIIATTIGASKLKKNKIEKMGIKVLSYPSAQIPLKKLIKSLTKLGIISILVEGGAQAISDFVDHKFVDRVYGFYAPIIIGGSEAVTLGGQGTKLLTDSIHLKDTNLKKLGDNFLIEGRV